MRVAAGLLCVGAVLAAPHISFNLSDVLSTNREGSVSRLAANAAYNTTKLVWVYTTSSSFVQDVVGRGWGLQVAANSETVDYPGVNRTYEHGRIEDIYGNKLTAPWMRTWTPEPYWGCVNNPAFKNSSKAFYKLLIDAGARLLQHDDPFMNVEALSWKPHKGCFCDYCDKGFTAYLYGRLTPEQLKELGVTGRSWSYKQTLLRNETSSALEQYYVDFQTESVEDHYHDMRSYVDELAGEHIPWSSNNNGGSWAGPIYPLFEAGVAELYPSRHCAPHVVNGTDFMTCSPADLIAAFSPAWSLGKQQALTVPKLGDQVKPWGCNVTNTSWFRLQLRRVSATSYAIGGHIITPYDIYEPDNCPRLYGDPTDYADIFALVRQHPWLLDGWVNATAFESSGQGGGGAVAANETDVYTYWRKPDPSSPRYGPATSLTAVLHVVDYRGLYPMPPGAHKDVNVTVDLSKLCAGTGQAAGAPEAGEATAVVYSTLRTQGRQLTTTGSITVFQEELAPWVMISIACSS